MTTAVQHRRGTTAEHSTFTGLEGEVTIDTTKDTAVIHDGALAGGYPLAKENLNNANPSTLGALDGASSAADDLFLVYDTSASQMKKMTRAELNNAITVEALDTVDINGGTIDGTVIGGTTRAAGSFTTLNANGNTTLGDASTDTVTVNGYMGVGTAPSSSNALTVSTGASRAGRFVRTTVSPSSATYALEVDGTAQTANMTAAGAFNVATNGKPNAFTIDGNGQVSVSGNTTLGDASTDTVQVNGYMGVGTAPQAPIGLLTNPTVLSGTTQIGFSGRVTGNSAATLKIIGNQAWARTAAEVFTVTDLAHFDAVDAIKGAGSTITNQHGLYIADQTQGTNNYGITSLVSSGTNKWNIYASGTADNYFAGNVGIGVTNPSARIHASASVDVGIFTSTSTNLHTANATVKIQNTGDLTVNTFGHRLLDLDYNADASGVTGTYIRLLTGGSERYGIGLANDEFVITGGGTERLRIGTTEAVFNDPGNDYDFRVESDTNTHALFVEGSSGNVGIGTSSPTNVKLQLNNAGTDTIGTGNLGFAGGSSPLWVWRLGATNADLNLDRYSGSWQSTPALTVKRDTGNVGIGTSLPTEMLDVNSDAIRIRTAQTPASATATGNAGDICWDANYVYVCVATNTWKRAALSTW